MSHLLEQLIQWAQAEDPIRAILLLGSLGGGRHVDAFSDYDLSIFCTDNKPYTHSTQWLSRFGVVWVCVKETITCCHKTFPSRLVIFEGGLKADFSFLSMEVLEELTRSCPLPDPYNAGYKVLLDKDHKADSLPKPQCIFSSTKPTQQAFHQVIEEFWFEVYHVAVALKRKDLWLVKERSHAAQTFLLRMIEWHAQVKNGWQRSPPLLGKRMSSWVSLELWRELHGLFARFHADESWSSLMNIMDLFQRLTAETGGALQYSSLEELSENMRRFVITLRE